MSKQEERAVAWRTLIAATRTAYASGHAASLLVVTGTSSPSDSAVGVLITALANVAENTITAQQVIDANAALTTLQTQAPAMAVAIEQFMVAVTAANVGICAE